MTRRHYFFLFILGFAVACGVAGFQKTPGYMDADYYLLNGMQLAEGKGLTEPVLWNYLDDPDGLPHPSHGYWMPLASILSAIGIFFTPFDGFAGGRIIFLFLAGGIPPVTAWLAWGLLSDRSEHLRRNMATLAGVMAAFSGFYLPFLTVPDAFGVYMLLGALILGMSQSEDNWKKWLGLGILAGFMHLVRADGFLWLGVVMLSALPYRKPTRGGIFHLAYSILGYLIVMMPWFLRNLSVFGTPLAPGGVRALWVLNYDELVAFPASVLTFERWWAAGVGEILRARGWALWLNLQTTLGVQGQVFLLPLILWGLWRMRERQMVRLGCLAWALTLGVMTVVFPFSGARGGFFHSGAAVQPLFWAVAPVGLEAFVTWGGRVRGWRVAQAQKVFGAGLVGLAIFVTAAIFGMRVLPGERGLNYRDVEQKLVDIGAKPEALVMVNNPPGYFLASGRPAVVVPYGNEAVLLEAAEKYGVQYIVLDENIPVGLRGLYETPETAQGLQYLGALNGFQLFEVAP